jgi:phosphoglycerol transferase MdoB-like AlkP superfamily enzyme
LRNRLLRLGPLAPVVVPFVGLLLVLLASRLALVLQYADRVTQVGGFLWLFPIGLRMDLSLLCIALFPPTLAVLILPERAGRWWKPVVASYLTSIACLVVFFEAATFPYLAQYDGRPNRVFVDYLQYPREVFTTVWAGHALAVVCGMALVGLTGRIVWRETGRLLRESARWSYTMRILLAPPLATVLVLGMRGTLARRAVNISTAAFSNDHLTNELALDSAYTVGYAVYSRRNEIDPGLLYGRLPRDEAIARVRRQSLLADGAFFDPDIPLLHRQTPLTPREHPYNLVIILEESLGAEYVGSLGGLPLTPSLDALSEQGLFLTNLYATGTRTVRGIEATVAGMLPTTATSVVKLGLAQRDFFTIAELLRRRGYATEFLYGGASNFDNMASFLRGNGFERLFDEGSFPADAFHGVWGVSDEDLFRQANATFQAHGDQPFFALMLSTSNHDPWEFPANRVTLYEQPPKTRNNAIRYADFALGEFFRLARQQDYFSRTVFLVVADHDTRVFGADLVPIDRFHIPGFILGPGVEPRSLDTIASQVDLVPTLLDVMGLDCEHPMVGRDLLRMPPGTPGHAFMQYENTNAYRVGDQVVVHEPYRPPKQFTYRDGRLVPTALDPEMARDALAHVQVPSMLYQERSYRLPPE